LLIRINNSTSRTPRGVFALVTLLVVAIAYQLIDNYTFLTYSTHMNLTMRSVTFIELASFTKHIYDYFSDESYINLQNYLIHHPEAGVVIRETGGCRKLRWAAKGHGKRGGVRIIYYYRRANGQMWMLTIHAKNEAESIPAKELRALREEIDTY
jgi:hypothetical protein